MHLIENKARFVNPRLGPALTTKLQDKIVGQTRLNRTDNEEADWVVTGYISDYNIETSGINGKQASMNRLTVAVEITLKDNKTQKSTDYSVTKSFEFNSSKSLEQAGNELFDDILKGVSDEIFNRLFSNW